SKRRIIYSLVVFFLIMFSLAASRAGMIGLILSLPILAIVKIRKRTSRIRVTFAFILLAGALLSVMLVNPKMAALVDELRTGAYSTSPRMASWVTSIQIIKENWVLGVGLHNVEPELVELYLALGFD